jgi:hypothetical protein
MSEPASGTTEATPLKSAPSKACNVLLGLGAGLPAFGLYMGFVRHANPAFVFGLILKPPAAAPQAAAPQIPHAAVPQSPTPQASADRVKLLDTTLGDILDLLQAALRKDSEGAGVAPAAGAHKPPGPASSTH